MGWRGAGGWMGLQEQKDSVGVGGPVSGGTIRVTLRGHQSHLRPRYGKSGK